MFVIEFFSDKGWEEIYAGDDLILAVAKFRLASQEGDVRFSTFTSGNGGAFYGLDLFNVTQTFPQWVSNRERESNLADAS